jgi:hypothetical protein
LGSAAYTASTAYATAAQGAKADTALQSGDNISELVNNAGYITGITSTDVTTALGYTPVNPSSLATVATSGDYDDLTNKPTLGTMAAESASDYTKTSGLATVATTGAYSDLSGTPTIPTVNDATLTITQGGVTKGTFTANASSDVSIDLDAGGDGANKDLSNLTSQGQNIANWSTNVANCITEIAQDIKLELNNGTLTLKAGSKAYVPNGADNFDVVNVSSDITLTQQWGENIDCLLFVYGGSILNIMPINRCSSGASDSISGSDHFYYNTANNTLRVIESSGNIRNTAVSLPIAIVKMSGNGATVSSIQQVFNGFGYIGSTVFALPGVKGLIPNGRNDDGTLKNIEVTMRSVSIWTTQPTYSWDAYITTQTGNTIYALGTNDYHYNETENYNYFNGINNNSTWLCKITQSSGKITSLTPKTAFHALDWSDSSMIVGWGMPDYSAGVNKGAGTTHTATSRGWVMFKTTTSPSAGTIQINGIEFSKSSSGSYGTAFDTVQEFIPVDIGTTFFITNNASAVCIFYPCKGAN